MEEPILSQEQLDKDHETLRTGLESNAGINRLARMRTLDLMNESMELENEAYKKDIEIGGKLVDKEYGKLPEGEEGEDMSKQLAARDNITNNYSYYGDSAVAVGKESEAQVGDDKESPPEELKEKIVEVIKEVPVKVQEIVEIAKPLSGKVMSILGACAVGLPAMGFGMGYAAAPNPKPQTPELPFILEAVEPNGALKDSK